MLTRLGADVEITVADRPAARRTGAQRAAQRIATLDASRGFLPRRAMRGPPAMDERVVMLLFTC
jgi:hypothetical protein